MSLYRDLGETKRELLFHGLRVSALQDEMFRDLCTTMWVEWTPLNCTLKNGEGGEFHVMCIFFIMIYKKKNGYYKDGPVTTQTKYTAVPQPPSIPLVLPVHHPSVRTSAKESGGSYPQATHRSLWPLFWLPITTELCKWIFFPALNNLFLYHSKVIRALKDMLCCLEDWRVQSGWVHCLGQEETLVTSPLPSPHHPPSQAPNTFYPHRKGLSLSNHQGLQWWAEMVTKDVMWFLLS